MPRTAILLELPVLESARAECVDDGESVEILFCGHGDGHAFLASVTVKHFFGYDDGHCVLPSQIDF